MTIFRTITYLVAILIPWVSAAWSEATRPPAAWLTNAVTRVCGDASGNGLSAQQSLDGAWLLEESVKPRGRSGRRLTLRFALPGGDELRLVRTELSGRLRRFTAEYHGAEGTVMRPIMQATADGSCQVRAGRRIVRGPKGDHVKLDQLDGDLRTVRWTETLQAPWPDGRDGGGPRIALVDSGLAYDLPIYRNRLARAADGRPLGFDYWDMDPLPYDADVSRGPFLPIRHGSAVASVLVRESPTVALIPMRYPRPDMSRMAQLVERAAKSGARIIAMPLGSNRSSDWQSFARALRAHPDVLAIVSAGNNGRDLDQTPVWPAVLPLDNMIVVTSADAFGRLASGSNWGATTVDIMLPAENVPVVDFRGASGQASGSSYAVPRLAALAGRIIGAEPNLTIAELKARIFALAVPSPYEKDVVAVGWIPDPTRK